MNITLLEQNPWILELTGFLSAGFGLPRHDQVEDELGVVLHFVSEEHVTASKQKFRAMSCSSTRWEGYPIYYEVSVPTETETERKDNDQ